MTTTTTDAAAATAGPISRRLLSSENPKASKSAKFGWHNAIHYMAPANIAGAGNLCPDATPGCLSLCLGYHSGQAGMVADADDVANKNSVRSSRDVKARQFMTRRPEYMAALARQIEAEQRQADAAGLRLCVRLNGSTDVAFERVRDADGRTLPERFPNVQFTEYTKSLRRMLAFIAGQMPANVHLCFSLSETNAADARRVLELGSTVAAVVLTSQQQADALANGIDIAGETFPTQSGDRHDLRHLDDAGTVQVLVAKGSAAKRDQSGFVIRPAA